MPGRAGPVGMLESSSAAFAASSGTPLAGIGWRIEPSEESEADENAPSAVESDVGENGASELLAVAGLNLRSALSASLEDAGRFAALAPAGLGDALAAEKEENSAREGTVRDVDGEAGGANLAAAGVVTLRSVPAAPPGREPDAGAFAEANGTKAAPDGGGAAVGGSMTGGATGGARVAARLSG